MAEATRLSDKLLASSLYEFISINLATKNKMLLHERHTQRQQQYGIIYHNQTSVEGIQRYFEPIVLF